MRSASDLAGVFEFDGDTGYFYLYKTNAKEGEKIMAAIHIFSGRPNFEQRDISIRWTPDENVVGLFIRGKLQAAFDCKSGAAYGGCSSTGISGMIPPKISQSFEAK